MVSLVSLLILILWHTDVEAAITIVTEPYNVTVMTGTNATLACEVEGQNLLIGENVLWKKIVDGTTTDISENFKIEQASSPPKYAFASSTVGQYNLTVMNVDRTDTAEYQCSMSHDVTLTKTARLTVANLDSMSDLWLYWPGPSQSVVVGVSSALTCMLNNTDPAASFRWFKGQQEITDQAQNPSPTNNSQGLYSSHSVQTLTMKQEDAGMVIRCVADIRDLRDVKEAQITVQFSSVSIVRALCSLVVGAALFSLTNDN